MKQFLIDLTIRVCLLFGTGALCGCCAEAAPAVSQMEQKVVEAVKMVDTGDGLEKGKTREVTTTHGTVLVSRDAEGNVSYRKRVP